MLTPRETEVLGLIATGLSAKRAGQALGVSFRTIEAHMWNARQKLGARNASQAVAMFVRNEA